MSHPKTKNLRHALEEVFIPPLHLGERPDHEKPKQLSSTERANAGANEDKLLYRGCSLCQVSSSVTPSKSSKIKKETLGLSLSVSILILLPPVLPPRVFRGPEPRGHTQTLSLEATPTLDRTHTAPGAPRPCIRIGSSRWIHSQIWHPAFIIE